MWDMRNNVTAAGIVYPIRMQMHAAFCVLLLDDFRVVEFGVGEIR